MNASARNLISGTVKSVSFGHVAAEITLELAPGVEIVSVITKDSAEALGLKAGVKASALIKASNVMIITG